MILYLDSSALVKRYVREWDTAAVQAAIADAAVVGTAIIARAEVVAAFARARRLGALADDEAARTRSAFSEDWPHLLRLAVSEHVSARAADLAWHHGLRGYDAVHLAAASVWQDTVGEVTTLATYEVALWAAAQAIGLRPYPEDLEARLATRGKAR